MDMIDPQYTHLITNALSSEKQVRESAEKTLSELAVANPPKFLFNLASELADEGKQTPCRQMAAALMKNFILINEKSKLIWINLENNSKDQIKNLILSTLASQDKNVRKAAGLVIAAICKVDLPLTEKWPNLISSLCSNSYNENLNIRHAAIESLGYLCEELNNKSIDPLSVDSILTALIENITEKQVNDEILFTALNAFLHCLPLAEKNFLKPNELEIIMNALFDVCGNNMSKDSILEKVSQILIDICEIYYDFLDNFIMKIAEYAFWVIKNKSQSNEKLTLFCFEIWCSLGDEELSRLKSDTTSFSLSVLGSISAATVSLNNQNAKKKKSCKYFPALFDQLFDCCVNYINVEAEDEEEDTWDISKACNYILKILVQLIDSEKIDKLLNYILTNFDNEENLLVKNSTLLVFAAATDSSHKSKVWELVRIYFDKILKTLDHANARIRKSATSLLLKASKNFGKNFNTNQIELILTKCVGMINHNNKNSVKICSVFSSIIKARGDPNTIKNDNELSKYFDGLFTSFLNIALSKPEKSSGVENLSMHCFICLCDLIDNSSHDKQEKLTEILVYFVNQLNSTMLPENMSSSSIELLHQIQCYFCNIFRSCFRKKINMVDLNLAEKVYFSIEASFKFRNGVYEEGLLAIAALIDNIQHNFIPILPKILEYVVFALKSLKESSLLKAALLVLNSIVREAKTNFTQYSQEIIPLLIEILTNNDVNRNNKLITITNIGEIALNICDAFLPFLDPIMKLLFSAAQLAVTQADSEDEETIEYLKQLRYEIITAFTSISFCLDDCDKKTEFVQYVPTIFTFLKSIASDNYEPTCDILRSMLGFINDMVVSYGSEMRNLIDIQFIDKILFNLRKFKIKKFEDELFNQEEVIKSALS